MLTTGLGIFLVAIADAGSIEGNNGVAPLFWLGLLIMFVPITLRVTSRDVGNGERFGSIVLLGSALYVVNVLNSPTSFTFTDEFIHLRTTTDILLTHHLYAFNPLLPSAALYPGLATLTAGIADITGLSPFLAGLVIMGVVRVLLSACFFLVARRVTGSSRGAAWASLVYVSSPTFLFFASYFVYESIALPMAMFAIWWIDRTRNYRGIAPMFLTVPAIVAVAVTHPLVGFALTVTLTTWWWAELLLRGPSERNDRVGFMAAVAGVSATAWIFTIGNGTFAYLWNLNIAPDLANALGVILGHVHARTLYSSGGYVAPLWVHLVGFSSVVLLLAAVSLGTGLILWRHRTQPALLLAAAVALTYPLTLLLRFAPSGVGLSGRSSEYVFTGLACVVGLLMVDPAWRAPLGGRVARMLSLIPDTVRRAWPHHHHATSGTRTLQPAGGRSAFRFSTMARSETRRTLIGAALASVLFIGGITVGSPSNQVLPQSPHAPGYPLTSPANNVIAAAVWVRGHLPIGQTFATDNLDAEALGSYGLQDPIAGYEAYPIFFATTMDSTVVHYIRANRVDYLFWDIRLTRGLPPTPRYYFSQYEPEAGSRSHRLPAIDLLKFASAACTSRIYDTGGIFIYDVGGIADGSCDPTPHAHAHAKPPA